MLANDEEILSRLELTIQSWSGEVTSAHDTLSRQIGEAKDQLSTLMRVIASRNQNGHAITDVLEELQATKKQLARSAENLAGALEENARIKDQLHQFEAGTSSVPLDTIEKYENAIEDLNHELTLARDELKLNEAELQERDEALRAATKDAASLNETLSTVQREMETLHTATDEGLQEGTPEENLDALEREVREAVQYEDDLANQLEQAQEELRVANDRLATAQQNLDEKTDELTTANTTIEILQHEIEQKSAAVEDLESQNKKDQEFRAASDQNAHKNHLTTGSELTEAQAQIDRLRNALVIREETIEELQASLSDSDRSDPQSPPAEPIETPEVTGDPVEDIEARNRELQAALRDRDAEIDDLRIQLDDTEEEETDYADRIFGAAYDTRNQRRAMGEILVNAGIISQRQLEKALEEQQGNKQRRLGSILVEKGLIADEIVAQVLASQLRLPFVRLADLTIAPEASRLMNGRLATHHMSIPVRYEDGTVTVAMANPHDLIAIEDIEIETDSIVEAVVATLADITSAIVRVYGVDSSGTQTDPSAVA